MCHKCKGRCGVVGSPDHEQVITSRSISIANKDDTPTTHTSTRTNTVVLRRLRAQCTHENNNTDDPLVN